MPYRSFKQDAFMHAQHPDIAKRWDAETKRLGLPFPTKKTDGKASSVKPPFPPKQLTSKLKSAKPKELIGPGKNDSFMQAAMRQIGQK